MSGRDFSLLTPEGAPLDLEMADIGSRSISFLIDFALVTLASISIAALAAVAEGEGPPGYVTALALLAVFLLNSFYFIVFELRWQGRTPGKRALKLRVIARDGGPLTADLVFARNLSRELELVLPVMIIVSPELVVPAGSPWISVAALVWAAAFLVLPVLNRHRARLGDLLAGTIVISEPQALLETDLAGVALRTPERDLRFTPEQLDMYGIHELQVLEDLLRRVPDAETAELLAVVSEKVQRKIGWQPAADPPSPRAFLTEFYAAQRARLEHKLILGRRQERKVEGVLRRGGGAPGR